MDITLDEFKKLFKYDPETGKIYRLRFGIKECKSLNRGYIRIHHAGKSYFAHRMAWFYMTGTWPNEIDHIDGIRSNNKWDNLRDVNRSINQHNRKTVKGYTFNKKTKRWVAKIRVNYVSIYIGTFIREEQARDAYLKFKSIYHPGYIPIA